MSYSNQSPNPCENLVFPIAQQLESAGTDESWNQSSYPPCYECPITLGLPAVGPTFMDHEQVSDISLYRHMGTTKRKRAFTNVIQLYLKQSMLQIDALNTISYDQEVHSIISMKKRQQRVLGATVSSALTGKDSVAYAQAIQLV